MMSKNEIDKNWKYIKKIAESHAYTVNVNRYDVDAYQIIWNTPSEIVLEGNTKQTLDFINAITMIENQLY